jgi:hypothetical protein
MDEGGYGHFGVTFLRAAYEELVWIDYLMRHQDAIAELVSELPRKELADALGAQVDYLSVGEMHAIGFTMRWVKRVLPQLEKSNDRLKSIGKRLGWRDGQSVPSMAFLARKTKRDKEYRYLYQATSRYVHFSSHELLRRVWGKHGEVTISSDIFSKFWTDFALYWAIRMLVETVQVARLSVFQTGSVEVPTDFFARVEALRKVQMVTASELEGWDDPKPLPPVGKMR